MDEWIIYKKDEKRDYGERGLNSGEIYKRDGVMIEQVEKEGMIRVKEKKK